MSIINAYYFKPSKVCIGILCILSFIGCHSQDNRWLEEDKAIAQYDRLKYNLQSPNRKMKLHNDLEEISGLDFAGNNRLICVQDELGRVYYFNLESEKIEETTKFAKSGDYEGVEMVENNIYVTRHDGKLYSFPKNLKTLEKKDIDKYETPLSSKNDIEGLAYQPSSNSLLLACKGISDIDNKDVKGKAIYAFNLDNKKLTTSPLFTIRKSEINKFIEKHKDYYNIHKAPDIKPSGLAIHPKTKQIYVLASVGKALIILSPKGKIKDIAFLSDKIFRQPEGICFDPTGNLFIASEGVGGRGYIMEFKYKK